MAVQWLIVVVSLCARQLNDCVGLHCSIVHLGIKQKILLKKTLGRSGCFDRETATREEISSQMLDLWQRSGKMSAPIDPWLRHPLAFVTVNTPPLLIGLWTPEARFLVIYTVAALTRRHMTEDEISVGHCCHPVLFFWMKESWLNPLAPPLLFLLLS